MQQIERIITKVEKLKKEKNFQNAIKYIEQQLFKYADNYRLYEELADIYLYKWDLKKATKSINFALNLNKNSPTGNYLKWFILLSTDKIKESIKYLEKSNKEMWNNSEVLRNLGWAYTKLWSFERWVSILKRALNISPWDKLIIEDLAMAFISAWKTNRWNILLEQIWKNKI